MAPRRIPARRLAWLREELDGWRTEGLIDARAAEALAARYATGTRVRVVGLLLGLGAALLGAGLIWLVASNVDIDQVGPLARVGGLAAIWLALVAAGEACDGLERLDPFAGPLRLLAVVAYGAVIFQAAQSLQVPAYDPELVAAWAGGGLVYAYATASRAALVLAVGVGAGWLVTTLADAGGGAAFVLGLALVVPACAAAASLHERPGRRRAFAGPWRTLGAILGVIALFAAALPEVAGDGGVEPLDLGLAAAAAAGLAAGALALGAPGRRDEVMGAAALAVVAGALVALAPSDASLLGEDGPTAAESAFSFAAMLAFVAWAVAIAVVGAARDAPRLVDIAFAGLLGFVAVQSFGIIGSLLGGAALLLVVGTLLLALGFALDRGRRKLLDAAADG